jgi:FtsP/CotA-like multicopper oxidase with cupredoxin domain
MNLLIKFQTGTSNIKRRTIMNRRQNLIFKSLVLVVALFAWGIGPAGAQKKILPQKAQAVLPEQAKGVTQVDRQAAADRAAAAGFALPEIGTMQMVMPGEAPRYFSHPNYANSPLPGNIVSEWNAIAQEILQPTPMPGMPMGMSSVSMSAAFVYLSYVHAAVYNALVAIEGGYAPYKSTLATDPNASRDAAVVEAAYGVLNNYFPSDMLDEKYNAYLAAIPDSPAKIAGITVGQAAAIEIIALRSADVLSGDGGYSLPVPGPGVWEPTMVLPDGTLAPPMDPWMAVLTPFLRTSSSELQPVAPPDLASDEYAADLNEVMEIGGAMSTTRTAEQTEVARFWTTNMVIQTNAAYRQLAASRGLGLLDTARLMAMGNMAATDSLIATFDAKYFYNFWRPVTAIQRADTDGNDLTMADPTWMPLVMTPNFPEYVAGHGSFVSAQAEVYTRFFGTLQIEIDLDSSVTATTRHYATADELRTEIVNARTWGGLHFRNSSLLAVHIGQQLVANALETYFAPAADLSAHVNFSGGIRKFVDGMPGLDAANANNLGQYIPVAVPDITTYPGSDYYEIAVVQYREKMHSDLQGTLLRGYVQLSTATISDQQVPLENALIDGTTVPITGYTGVTKPHYLGPTIVAQKDRPVRILFRNLLPTGIDGDLFIPTDVTVMGSGMGPNMLDMTEMDPQNPMCGQGYDVNGTRIPKDPDCFAENRATLHLHGGISPWISDGTPHQWTTPAGENTSYPAGVSVVNVPDMGDPGPGAITFFYTNQQSARLMFYHDHSWGITRLNVYAGEAAPYIITDATEQLLLDHGLIPGPADTIPLVVQDKTFVPSMEQLAVSDELWDMTRWGGTGNLWLPHVYVPAQNPGDSSGVNQFGRWAYGPWFWPATAVDYPPITNAYYDPNCDPNVQWCEPPLMPSTPFNSMGMEAFQDTPVVNGTAYPTYTVQPKAYRFRILNAASDRFFNLHFYQAVDANGVVCDGSAPPAAESTGVACTEVRLNPAEVQAALADPAVVFPTPDMTTAGPDWIQIGTEGGFLPAPVVIPPQPITWVSDPTVFNAGNVDQHSLLLGPAERADVIVDFSAFAGQTLILYNDAPAAFPARDPRYDYYTGNADLRDTGGAPSTLPGYGPNTRTVMQIKVAAAAAAPFNLNALETAFKAESLGGQGVFEKGQHPIIVGQGAYNSAYGTAFPNSGALDGFARITDFAMTFNTLSGTLMNDFPFQPKAIQDEMGEAFEKEYGRMSGNLGLEVPLTQAGVQQNLILYPYVNPASELIDATSLPLAIDLNDPNYKVQPISVANDGTQIWKITHNGVDTHPIHFHLFDVQLLNRVGWDGIIRPPDANELGWKDTLRVSPLEDTIVALRPIIPVVPFDLPNSIRPLNPMMPLGSTLMFNSTDANANPTAPIINQLTNFGYEYVWHCHILSHEEMDMMRPISVAVPPKAPSDLVGQVAGNGRNRRVVLTWTDNSSNETGFAVQRALASTGPWTELATVAADVVTYTDPIGNTNQAYFYRVLASNIVGYAGVPGYSTLTVTGASNIAQVGQAQAQPPVAPTSLTATVQAGPQVLLTWTDNDTAETGFVIERAIGAGAFTTLITVGPRNNTGSVSYTDTTVAAGNTYAYRVAAVNSAGLSAYSNTASVSVASPPAAPTSVTATAARQGRNARVTLNWVDAAIDETGFTVQRATNPAFTANVVTTSIGANVTTYTTGNLARSTPYYFRVLAYNASGPSAWVNASPFPVTTP